MCQLRSQVEAMRFDKSDLNKDGKLSKYERKRGEAIAKSMVQRKRNGGSVEMQPRGCGAMMQSKRKKTRVPSS